MFAKETFNLNCFSHNKVLRTFDASEISNSILKSQVTQKRTCRKLEPGRESDLVSKLCRHHCKCDKSTYEVYRMAEKKCIKLV